MRLSWNEIRSRAAAFAEEWAGERYEKGQTQLFYREFFDVFGVPEHRVAGFEEQVEKLGNRRGNIEQFWKGVLLVEQRSVGRDLAKAKVQTLERFPDLKETELPSYILASDFQNFELHDHEMEETASFSLADLPRHVEKFGFILGVRKRRFRDQDPVNIAASEMLGSLHDALEDSGYVGHDLERFLVRTVFCLFADDTGIFEPRDLFLDFLESRTREDGSDVGCGLAKLFRALDTPENVRPKSLGGDLARFPYIGGDLFRGSLSIPSFDTEMRAKLIDACRFDWSNISPAIFGSLFQSVMNRNERRTQGAHYTTEKNILKVIEPLFMNGLRMEFERLKARKDNRRRNELRAFQKRLSEMTFLDPACGCGNFLVIAYRELRMLEIDVVRELIAYERNAEGQFADRLDVSDLSLLDVDQFHGIEIGEFPARIAETALWMMDHIMNNQLSLEFGRSFARIPLRKSPQIVHGDALEIDWPAVLPPEKCSFVFGNPPFVGAKYQTPAQRGQVRRIAALGKSGGTLDYVAAWFVKAGEYLLRGREAAIGFVSTNSISQGEQAAQLWPILFGRCRLEITFAHRAFAWGSETRNAAQVHVVVVGMSRRDAAPRYRTLYSYPNFRGDPDMSRHVAISPYLFDADVLADPHLVVREAPLPINGLPKLRIGSKPIDGGNYIFSDEEREAFVEKEPGAAAFLRPFVGSREFLNGGNRWILALHDASPSTLSGLPIVKERIARVRAFRLASGSEPTRELAATPTFYHVNVLPDASFLAIPEVSSERRDYVPIGWLEPPTIPSSLMRIIENADFPLFGLLSSAMHMSWLRHIGGRLESRYRYSIGLVYNTFPTPPCGNEALEALGPAARAVLDVRASYSESGLADLYDPHTMPPALRKAHLELDRAVDRLYKAKGFASERARVEHLLQLYEKMNAPLVQRIEDSVRRGRRSAK